MLDVSAFQVKAYSHDAVLPQLSQEYHDIIHIHKQYGKAWRDNSDMIQCARQTTQSLNRILYESYRVRMPKVFRFLGGLSQGETVGFFEDQATKYQFVVVAILLNL